MKLDTTTIDVDLLRRLCPEHKIPATYHLQAAPGGNGCSGDPPGYPTYFTRCIYTVRGNSPARGPDMLLFGCAVPEYSGNGDAQKALWQKIYRPLPIDHPRVVAWIRNKFRHQASCYYVPKELARKNDYGPRPFMIWPTPSYELQTFRDDPRFSDEWREKERAAVAAWNEEYVRQRRPYSTAEHHVATVGVREFYPDFPLEAAEALIAAPPTELSNWWERHDVPPEPGQCPGDREVSMRHRDEHCQFCGGHGNLPPATNPESQEK